MASFGISSGFKKPLCAIKYPMLIDKAGKLLLYTSDSQIPSYLKLEFPHFSVDPKVAEALSKTASNEKFKAPDDVLKKLQKKAALIDSVTRSINRKRGDLAPVVKFLLYCLDIYKYLLYTALYPDNAEEPLDIDKLALEVQVFSLLEAEDGPKAFFNALLITEKVKELGLADNPAAIGSLMNIAKANKLPLTTEALESTIKQEFEKYASLGTVYTKIDEYLVDNKDAIDVSIINDSLKNKMAQFLFGRGIKLDSTSDVTKLDEHFGAAYYYAMQSTDGSSDPLQALHFNTSVSDWDFEVDTFESVEDQEILPENIKAAGALFYIYYLGEQMGIYKLADAVVLNWSAGIIDVVDGAGADKLYRYWKMRDERMTDEERGMVYKRVFNFGDAEVLSRMVVNEQFQSLWDNLMTEVTEYIRRYEESSASNENFSTISKKPIELATKDIQYNLTEFTTGMTHMQIREMHSQLQDAIDILRDEQVLDHFGGRRRKTMWKVVEELSKSEFQQVPNVASLRTLAVDGYKIFQWFAKMDTVGMDAGAFLDFLHSAEAWIIALGSGGSEKTTVSTGGDNGDFAPDEEDDFEDF